MKKTSKKRPNTLWRRLGTPILGMLLLILGFLCYFSANWYFHYYGEQGFNSVLVTLFSGVNGVEGTIMKTYYQGPLFLTLICSGVLTLWCCNWSRFHLRLKLFGKKFTLSPLRPAVYLPLCALVCAVGVWNAAQTVSFPQWLETVGDVSTLISREYIAPEETEITYPEKKRNLVYILLESMETTFASKEQGGAMEESVIPELYQLAQENVSFSDTEGLGGWGYVSGTNWTTGGTVAQAGGIPLLLPFGGNEGDHMVRPLAAAHMLWDELHEQGYYQAVMMGSNVEFSGQLNLLRGHGIDRIYDHKYAKETGFIPQDYNVWWGIEDSRLYTYAKQELTKIAAQDQPFSFTLFTIDTHFPNGYTCPDCPRTFQDPYENVYACASAQVAAFVRWLQEQPFYENTTVIVCGDHLTMDNAYIQRAGLENARRRVYNCIINGAAQPENTKNRTFTPMDMYPTTLAALGCRIEGERLGLGTNLYSNVPTLAEKMGVDTLNWEINCSTLPYLFRFLLEPEQSQWLLDLFPNLIPQ